MKALRKLEYFIAAARTENLAAAARALNLSQPALSRQIRDMEIELGFDLFERVGRGIRLSVEGRRFASCACEALEKISQEICEIRASISDENAEPVRIGIQQFTGQRLAVVETLGRIRNAMVGRQSKLVPMTSRAQAKAIEMGELDAGIMYEWAMTDRLAGVVIDADRWNLIVPVGHRLAGSKTARLLDLVGERFVTIDPALGPPLFDALFDACRAKGLEPDIVYSVDNANALSSLVANDNCVGFLTEFSTVRDGVEVVQIQDLEITLALMLSWRRKSLFEKTWKTC